MERIFCSPLAVRCRFYNRLPSSHTDDDGNLYSSSGSYTLEDTIDVYGNYDYYANKKTRTKTISSMMTIPLRGRDISFYPAHPSGITRAASHMLFPRTWSVELHHVYNRVTWMHTERRKLVKGLRSADGKNSAGELGGNFRDYVKRHEEEEADFMTVLAFLTKDGVQTQTMDRNDWDDPVEKFSIDHYLCPCPILDSYPSKLDLHDEHSND